MYIGRCSRGKRCISNKHNISLIQVQSRKAMPGNHTMRHLYGTCILRTLYHNLCKHNEDEFTLWFCANWAHYNRVQSSIIALANVIMHWLAIVLRWLHLHFFILLFRLSAMCLKVHDYSQDHSQAIMILYLSKWETWYMTALLEYQYYSSIDYSTRIHYTVKHMQCHSFDWGF